MELRQLEYLAAVVSHGSFGRAAQEIYVTQSALSQQIARLEEELGLTLLHRGPKGVEPTPAGLEFLDHARAILGRVCEARAVLDDHIGAIRGTARVTATDYDSGALPVALAAFHRAHPQVQLSFQHSAAAQVIEQLTTGLADVALLALDAAAAKLPDHITQQTIAEEPLRLITPPGDQLSGGAHHGVTIDDLRGRSVVMPGRGTALRSLLDDAFAQVGFSPLPRFETNHPETIRELVGTGLGVSIVPRSWLADHGPAVTSVELAQPLPSYRVALLSSTRPRIPARDRLVEHLLVALSTGGRRCPAG